MIRQLRLRPAPALGFALGLGLIVAPGPAHAARISATYALSAEDQGRATVLDQSGRTIPIRRGSLPTYVVYPVSNSAVLPGDLTTIAVRAGRSGPTTGPLRLDAASQVQLNAALAADGQAAVLTPRRTFLVESIAPVSARLAAEAASASAAGDESVKATAAAVAARVESKVKSWYSSGSNSFKRWSREVGDDLRDRLKLRSPRVADHKPPAPTPTFAAQVLAPPDLAAAQTLAAPAPVPEPAGLLVFATAAAAAAFRFRFRVTARSASE
jgi:hypothetical protein